MAAVLYNDWYFDGGRVYFRTTDVRIYNPGDYQKHNIYKIYTYFTAQGWTLNAIAGMIGNMMVESGCNPGCCESSSMDWDNPSTILSTNRGIGLTQWTPARKYYNWATSNNLDPKDGDTQCARIQYEHDNNLQWSLNNYGNHTWDQFIHSTETPEILARVFVWAYERPSNPDVSQRQANARWVYDWLLTQPTPPSPSPDDPNWIKGQAFAALATAYDPTITGVPIPYSQMDCITYVQTVWRDIPAVSASDVLSNPLGTNTLWRTNTPQYPSLVNTFNTTSPDSQNPTPVLWYKDTLSNCISRYGSIPPGTLLFHQISEAGPPAIPPQYEGDGIGNFAHVGIYIGNNEVMQSGGRDASPGEGVHRSAYDSNAWNYAAFVVWVDPTEEDPEPGPDPGPGDIPHYLFSWYINKKKGVTKRVIRTI